MKHGIISRNMRCAVAMSGGVDSAVTAYILKKQGFHVLGVYLRMNHLPRPVWKGREDMLEDICRKLGIELVVIDVHNEFYRMIIDPFCREYIEGRTPNPCIKCNYSIKFGILLQRLDELRCDCIATGHYARVEYDRKKRLFVLKKALDKHKDQSYFLYRLGNEQLKRIIMPLGNLYKTEVMGLAENISGSFTKMRESQEICFIDNNDYRSFISSMPGNICIPGYIRDRENRILGKHDGIINYTVGQRRGLNIAKGYPLYVIKIDKERNEIIVGEKKDAFTKAVLIEDTAWNTPAFDKIRLKARIRYQHEPVYAEITCNEKKECMVSFAFPQFAVTPGQSVVFYRYNTVMGGGTIKNLI